MVLVSAFLISSTLASSSFAADYTRVGLNLGDTADYSVSRTNVPSTLVNLMRVQVVNTTGVLFELNITLYFQNGTVYQTWLQHGNVSGGELQAYMIVADLSAGEPIALIAGAPTINETVTMTVMGGPRTVNHLRQISGNVTSEHYWDQKSGLIVQRNYNDQGEWINYTLLATSVWSPVAKPIVFMLLLAGGVSSFTIVFAALTLYLTRKSRKMRGGAAYSWPALSYKFIQGLGSFTNALVAGYRVLGEYLLYLAAFFLVTDINYRY
jgi:hypothetical protein